MPNRMLHKKSYLNNDSIINSIKLTQPDVNYLLRLWTMVRENELFAYEALHAILYPVYFNQLNDILNDNEQTDKILCEVFIHFWLNRNKISAEFLILDMLVVINNKLAAYLPSHTDDGLRVIKYQYISDESLSAFGQTSGRYYNISHS